MNPFARHGINHLSASSLSVWREHPGLWALKYLGGVRDDDSPAAWRGLAVEAGLTQSLRRSSLGMTPTDVAMTTFEQKAVGEASDEIESERRLIEPMLRQASSWEPPSAVVTTQLRIEHWFDGLPVPLIGYTDFTFECGLILDLKTTKACPSSPRPPHVRQVALYRAARNMAKGALLYVTDKKRAYYEVADAATGAALNELRSDALSLAAFLARVDSPRDALMCLPFNSDDFRVSKQHRVEYAGLIGD